MAPYNDEAAEDEEGKEDQRRIQDFYRNIGERQKQRMESGSGTCIPPFRWLTLYAEYKIPEKELEWYFQIKENLIEGVEKDFS